MGGGSLLSLAGITERLSEDVDINVTFVDGADACKPKWGKRLMEECQAQVEENLDIKGTRDPNGGGNYFRTVHDEDAFRDLLEDAATNGGVDIQPSRAGLQWMCQIASEVLLLESKRYPGSYTSMGGGSLLSLAGITERLSEDVDINVTFVDGADACKPKWGKRLIGKAPASRRVIAGPIDRLRAHREPLRAQLR